MKTYSQYCGLAKALDHVGDRWTLLIVRELLIESRRYSQIRAALPGIATNLLAERLRDLDEDGVISQNPDRTYELTEFGRGLEEVIHGLVRWGGHWMTTRNKTDVFEPEWLAIALKALLPGFRKGRIQVEVDGAVVALDRGEVRVGPLNEPDAVVKGSPEAILGVAAGELPLAALKVSGSRAVVKSIFAPGTPPARRQ